MNEFTFKKAEKRKTRLRLALFGPSGSGKTWTALAFAKKLGGKIALIDTEHGSASLYSDRVDFDALELNSFSPDNYVAAINAAAKAGYDILVIDSLSHAWAGKDGSLEQVDRAKSNERNAFSAWRTVTPKHNALVEAVLQYPGHVIVTMRAKMEYVLEKDERTGKQVPRKVGLAPIQRDGMEYEFDVVGDMNIDHVLNISKTRCEALDSACVERPTGDFLDPLISWLNSGADYAPVAPMPQPTQPAPQPEVRSANLPTFPYITVARQNAEPEAKLAASAFKSNGEAAPNLDEFKSIASAVAVEMGIPPGPYNGDIQTYDRFVATVQHRVMAAADKAVMA